MRRSTPAAMCRVSCELQPSCWPMRSSTTPSSPASRSTPISSSSGIDENAPVGTLEDETRRGSHRRDLRPAQGALRAGRRAGHARPGAERSPWPDRRPARLRPTASPTGRGASRRAARCWRPAGPSTARQIIDVRDLAEWTMRDGRAAPDRRLQRHRAGISADDRPGAGRMPGRRAAAMRRLPG